MAKFNSVELGSFKFDCVRRHVSENCTTVNVMWILKLGHGIVCIWIIYFKRKLDDIEKTTFIY